MKTRSILVLSAFVLVGFSSCEESTGSAANRATAKAEQIQKWEREREECGREILRNMQYLEERENALSLARTALSQLQTAPPANLLRIDIERWQKCHEELLVQLAAAKEELKRIDAIGDSERLVYRSERPDYVTAFRKYKESLREAKSAASLESTLKSNGDNAKRYDRLIRLTLPEVMDAYGSK